MHSKIHLNISVFQISDKLKIKTWNLSFSDDKALVIEKSKI